MTPTGTIPKVFAAAFSIACLLIQNAFGQSEREPAVRVIDYGIYTAALVDTVTDTNSPTDRVRFIEPKLFAQTNVIPAKMGTKFGFRYKLTGRQDGISVPLDFCFTYPTITNAQSGKASSQYKVSGALPISATTQGMFWDLVNAWELRPGEWTMTISTGERVLTRQVFHVKDDTE